MAERKGRTTVYNSIATDEKRQQINKDNISLMEDFLDYLKSVDRSPQTLNAYRNDLYIFFTYVLDELKNKKFQEITKRDFAKFQSHCMNEWEWSSRRVRRVKSAISSMSNFIENMLDEEEEFEGFKKVISKIESPTISAVREKTILTDEEVQLILDTLLERKEYQRACAIAILAYSGMRKAELLQMRPEFFDENHVVFNALHQTDLVRAKGRGKNGHMMKKWIMMAADKYIMPWLEQRKELGIDNEWLFVSKRSGQWERLIDVDHWMDSISEIVNKPVYAHSFRHFVCSKLLGDYNLPSEVVREFFQWESVEMLKIYNDRSAIDDFGKYFTSEGVQAQESGSLSDIK